MRRLTADEIADYQRRLREALDERRQQTIDELLEQGRPSRRRQAGLSADEVVAAYQQPHVRAFLEERRQQTIDQLLEQRRRRQAGLS